MLDFIFSLTMWSYSAILWVKNSYCIKWYIFCCTYIVKYMTFWRRVIWPAVVEICIHETSVHLVLTLLRRRVKIWFFLLRIKHTYQFYRANRGGAYTWRHSRVCSTSLDLGNENRRHKLLNKQLRMVTSMLYHGNNQASCSLMTSNRLCTETKQLSNYVTGCFTNTVKGV